MRTTMINKNKGMKRPISDEFLDELMMGAVNYIDDDFLDKKVTASFRMPTKTITERIFEAIVQKIERPAISVASCGSFSLNVERKCNVLEPIILMYCSCDNTNFFHESMEEQLNKVIEVSGDDMYLSYLADIWKNLSIPKIGCSIQDDEFEKVFHLPFTTQWEKIYAECDGNSYLINSYNGNNYIQTSYIKNNFICVPQKASYKFNTAKIDVERIDISSITIPASITSVYMKVRSCEKLFDISFIDFSLMRGSRKIKDLWVEISNCENLKYIRFPMGTYSFSKLLITECASLEDVYIPGKVVKSSTNNISLDRRSCPQIKIISDDDSIVEYAKDTNIPIRA